MSNFDKAFAFMSGHEWNQRRNYTDTPGDPGGPTKYGLTLATLRRDGTLYDLNHDGVVDSLDVMQLTEDEAKAKYQESYWLADHLDLLTDDRLASKVFDMAVNLGPPRAIMYLQEVANSFGGQQLLVDGRLGPATATVINGLAPDRVLDGLVTTLTQHYTTWVNTDAHDREKFRAGLLSRAQDLPPQE